MSRIITPNGSIEVNTAAPPVKPLHVGFVMFDEKTGGNKIVHEILNSPVAPNLHDIIMNGPEVYRVLQRAFLSVSDAIYIECVIEPVVAVASKDKNGDGKLAN